MRSTQTAWINGEICVNSGGQGKMPGQGDCVGYGGYRGYGGYGFPWALISQLLRNLRNMFAEIPLQINQNIAAKQNLITN